MTGRSASIEEPGRIRLDKQEPSTSVQARSSQAAVYLRYNPEGLEARLEVIELEDAGLQRSWGDDVTRIILQTRDGRLKDTVVVTVGY